MEEWDMVTSRDGDEVEEPVEGMEDGSAANGGNVTEMLPVSPLKRRGVAATEETEVQEEKPSTDSVPTSPKSTVADTAGADVEDSSMDSALVLNEALEEGPAVITVPTSENSSVANTATADAQEAGIHSAETVVLEDDSSGSDSVPPMPKSSDPNSASADLSQEANDSDSVLTVVLEEESSESDSVPTSPKSTVSSSASSDVVPLSNTDSASVLNEMLQEEPARSDSVPASEANTDSADVTQQANEDDPEVLDEELDEKPSARGSVTIWKDSPASDEDPNKVQEEEVKSATEEIEIESLILNDKSLLAESLIAKLINVMLAKKDSEVNAFEIKSNSRKRPSSAISGAEASGGTSDLITPGPPPQTMATGSIKLMDYYISKPKKGGKEYDFSRLLKDNPGLISELNYYTERMKSFIMFPVDQPNKEMESSGKRAREEDKTNGAQNSKMINLA